VGIYLGFGHCIDNIIIIYLLDRLNPVPLLPDKDLCMIKDINQPAEKSKVVLDKNSR